MKIIWADHDPSWGISSREEAKVELAAAQEFLQADSKKEDKQEKSPFRGFKEN